MDKKKGLADMQDGAFILNESGTSVTTDDVEVNAGANENASAATKQEDDEDAGNNKGS